MCTNVNISVVCRKMLTAHILSGNWAKQMLILNKNKLTFIVLLESQQGYFKRSFILSLLYVFRVSWPSSTAQINLWIICLGIYSEHLFLYAYKTLASKHTHHSWKPGTEFRFFWKYYKVRGLRYTGRFCWSLLTHLHMRTHTHEKCMFVQFKNRSQKRKKLIMCQLVLFFWVIGLKKNQCLPFFFNLRRFIQL